MAASAPIALDAEAGVRGVAAHRLHDRPDEEKPPPSTEAAARKIKRPDGEPVFVVGRQRLCRPAQGRPDRPVGIDPGQRGGAKRDQPQELPEGTGHHRRAQDHLLRPPARRQDRKARQRRRPDGIGREGDRRDAGGAAQPVDVGRPAACVRQHAGGHEQQRLEQRVDDEMRHRHARRAPCPRPAAM